MTLSETAPLRDFGTVLSQCAHVVVPRDEQDSFEYDPKEEVDIEKEKDGDSDESDEDYVPEGGSDGEGGEIQKEGVGEIQEGGAGEIQKEVWYVASWNTLFAESPFFAEFFIFISNLFHQCNLLHVCDVYH